MNTLSVTELVWLLITLAGLVISAANLMDASDSVTIANHSQGDPLLKRIKQSIAGEHVRVEITYMLVHGLFLIIGSVAALNPPVPPPDGLVASRPVLIAAVLVPAAFFIVQIAMIVNSWMIRKTRKYIVNLRVLAAASSESKGTFDYKAVKGGNGGKGTFSMKGGAGGVPGGQRETDPPLPDQEQAQPLAPPPEEAESEA